MNIWSRSESGGSLGIVGRGGRRRIGNNPRGGNQGEIWKLDLTQVEFGAPTVTDVILRRVTKKRQQAQRGEKRKGCHKNHGERRGKNLRGKMI